MKNIRKLLKRFVILAGVLMIVIDVSEQNVNFVKAANYEVLPDAYNKNASIEIKTRLDNGLNTYGVYTEEQLDYTDSFKSECRQFLVDFCGASEDTVNSFSLTDKDAKTYTMFFSPEYISEVKRMMKEREECINFLKNDTSQIVNNKENEEEVVKEIADYVCKTLSYDHSLKNDTLGKSLDSKKGTCVSYALLFKEVANLHEIDVRFARGQRKGNNGVWYCHKI